MWLQQDRVCGHYVCAVRECLKVAYRHKLIRRAGTIQWPLCSRDRNYIDFVWGYYKEKVYITEIQSEVQLCQIILVAVNKIRDNRKRTRHFDQFFKNK